MLCSNCLSGQINLASSLTACYALNGNGSEPVNNFTAILSAVTPTVDRLGNNFRAFEFAGNANSYIELPNDSLIKPPNAITVAGWFRFNYFGDMNLVSTRGNSANFFSAFGLNLHIGFVGHILRVLKQDGTNLNFADAAVSFSPQTWNHIAFSIDNSFMKLYVNGTLKATATVTISGFKYDIQKGVIVGGTKDLQYNKPFSGGVDNLRLYNRVLSGNEISALQILDPVCMNNGLAPVASFTLSALQVCSGATVSMSDQSANFPTSWTWSFPGAATGDSTKPTPTYTMGPAGVYTVQLVAHNSNGTSTNTAKQIINVVPGPTVTATSTKTLYCRHESCTLYASGATSYSWSTGQSGSVIVTVPLSQTIYSVTGEGSNGCMDTTSIKIRVSICESVDIKKLLQETIVVYPNPAASYVKISGKYFGTGRVILYNSAGQAVCEANLNAGEAVLDLMGLHAGLYFILLIDGIENKRITVIKE
jgi:PKD repeat protein